MSLDRATVYQEALDFVDERFARALATRGQPRFSPIVMPHYPGPEAATLVARKILNQLLVTASPPVVRAFMHLTGLGAPGETTITGGMVANLRDAMRTDLGLGIMRKDGYPNPEGFWLGKLDV